MSTLRCVVKTEVYASETGWKVLGVLPEGRGHDLQTAVGYLAGVGVGAYVLLEGVWDEDPRYGRRFKVERWSDTEPQTLEGIERYLASGTIKGIGLAKARDIVRTFGADTLDILDNDIDRLSQVPGLGAKSLAQIKASWNKARQGRQAMVFLQGKGISAAYAARIYKQYGDKAVKIVKDTPYRLAEEVSGIGFRLADDIARNLGFDVHDEGRIEAGILYQLRRMAEDGHVFGRRDELVASAAKLLEVDAEEAAAAVDRLASTRRLRVEDEAVYLPLYYACERGSARRLAAICTASAPLRPGPTPEPEGIHYDEVQLRAIDTAAKAKVMVLTGGPGTGKTTTVKGIIGAFRSRKMKILLAAPTGRAAKRLSQATGMEARTVHRLLEFQPDGFFGRDADNPLEGDVLIVDECSMLNLPLFYSLLKAVPDSMRLVLAGDADQLPSVGAGNVLADIIASETIPTVRLTRIFRQAMESRIITNAHAINAGMMPDISNGRDTDFFFIETPPDAVGDLVVDLVSRRLPASYGVPAQEVQVLTPMVKGELGAAALNERLRDVLNPEGLRFAARDSSFRRGDKVMQVRNNYDKNVFNGDIGTVVHVDNKALTLTVLFDDRRVEYQANELDDLSAAYAITIHKSQGSEFDIVVIPVVPGSPRDAPAQPHLHGHNARQESVRACRERRGAALRHRPAPGREPQHTPAAEAARRNGPHITSEAYGIPQHAWKMGRATCRRRAHGRGLRHRRDQLAHVAPRNRHHRHARQPDGCGRGEDAQRHDRGPAGRRRLAQNQRHGARRPRLHGLQPHRDGCAFRPLRHLRHSRRRIPHGAHPRRLLPSPQIVSMR